MQLYKLLYALDVCLMLLAQLVLAADPAQLEHALAVPANTTFILLYFGAQSRCKSGSNRVSEGFIGMLLFASLNMLLSCFVTQHWDHGIQVKLCSVGMLSLLTLLLAGLHVTMTKDTRTCDVILCCTVLSGACSAYFAILLAVDDNLLS